MLIILSNNPALTESVLVPTKEKYLQYGDKYLKCTSSRCLKRLDGLVKFFPQHGFGQGYFFTSLDFIFWLCHDSPLSSCRFTWCFKLEIDDNSRLQSSLGTQITFLHALPSHDLNGHASCNCKRNHILGKQMFSAKNKKIKNYASVKWY